ncbi:hypothetical protein [Gordonia crocea]|uniref:Uncharacterized protein n=1 Tax=Gordonia crocea TaxID=589162 RepID=A0A7I9UWQ7_9ACTN|nr:hypothetical protein [Gordonia crocea]GED97210.1 hypothetical protein nbrc107697_12490 [Gordonia crocea]
MHTIDFRVERELGGAMEITPLVDGDSLVDLVEQFEVGRRFDPAGAYGGLIPEFYDFGPLEDFFVSGFPAWSDGSEAVRIPVLGCGDCREWGCWPLECTVTVDGGDVTWDGFAQPHRPEWDYTGFGPFRFDCVAYRAAVARMAAALSR